MIDRSVVDQVRQRTDLVELVGQYMPLRRAGMNWIARCPFHEERTPSFNVSAERGFYFCFGCKASGDALRFYEQIEGVNFVEALRALAERAGVELPETRDPERIAEDRRQRDVGERLAAACESAAVYFEQCLVNAPYGELARDALSERGISEELATRFRLGYAPARWDGLAEHLKAQRVSPADAELAGLLMAGRNGGWYDRFRHRLMFPVVDRAGRVVAFSGRVLPVTEDMPEGLVPEDAGKYINSPETPLYKKSELLYGLGVARTAMRQKAEAILVEGNFDVVQMHQQGFNETVAPLGTSFTEAQARLLRRFAESVVLVFDGDEAGRKAARASHSVCAKAGLVARVGVLPPKTDPDGYLRSTDEGKGIPGMVEVLKSAPSVVEWLIKDAALNTGDNAPERVAAARALAPVISDVRDSIEREVYVRLAAKALYLEEHLVVRAIREHQAQAAQAAKAMPFAAAHPGLRAGLTAPDDTNEDVPQMTRRATASGLESMLLCPELFERAEVEEFAAMIDEALKPFARGARDQWVTNQRLDAPTLLELCPNEATRHWIAQRLVPADDDGTLKEKCQASLLGAVATLRRLRVKDAARALKQQSARAGMQGDPKGEEQTLNEQLNMKRDLVRKRRDGT